MKINRNIKVAMAIALILSLLVAVFYYLFNDGYKYNWSENYQYDNDQPYGVDILYDMLNQYHKEYDIELIDKENITSFLERKDLINPGNDTVQKASYFMIGNRINFAYRDYESLISFLENGNTVMLVSSELPRDLLEQIDYDCGSNFNSNYYYLSNTYLFSLKANFESPQLNKRGAYTFFYEHRSEREDYNYRYFGSNMCRSLNYEVLGSIMPNKINYIKIPVGNGQLLLHSNPIFFSNRHLLREDAIEYAEKCFSYLPDGPIFWDKLNKPIFVKKPTMEGNEDDTPFTYILKQRSFKWALYLIYIAVALFLIFNLFRKQKEIPIKFQNKNTSLEFIKNVGTLYYDNKDNKKLALKMMQHFMNEIRLKYFITVKEKEIIIEKLASKTKVDSKKIKSIFDAYKFIERQTELSDDGLIKFYLKIETFHKSIKK